MNVPLGSNSKSRDASPLRVYTNTSPFEFVATPMPSPRYKPVGSFRKLGTESNAICGAVAKAFAGGGTFCCANSGCVNSGAAKAPAKSSEQTRMTMTVWRLISRPPVHFREKRMEHVRDADLMSE